VQLRHVPTETSWEDTVDHGYIAIFDPAGTKLLRKDGFQHNRNLRQGGAFDLNAIKAVVAEVTAALEKTKPALKIADAVQIPDAVGAGAA